MTFEALAKPGFCSGGLRPPAVWLAISAVGDRRYRVLQAHLSSTFPTTLATKERRIALPLASHLSQFEGLPRSAEVFLREGDREATIYTIARKSNTISMIRLGKVSTRYINGSWSKWIAWKGR
jgi:hypothetical protein